MTSENNTILEMTVDEKAFQVAVRATYNSGRMREAYEQAAGYYAKNPGSVFAKFYYGVMAGDYSDDRSLPEAMRRELLETARRETKEVYLDKDLKRRPFCTHARNEYFWFHALYDSQYQLGVERVASGELRGYYSMCVGASAMAKKCLLEQRDAVIAGDWAEKAVKAFREFEKVDPDWYNINHFYAYALAILGDADGAIAAYKDMYRKQKGPVNELEVKNFLADVELITNALKLKE